METTKAVDHTDSQGVARVLALNPDPEIAQQGRRMAAMLEARARGITDPEKLREISRNTR